MKSNGRSKNEDSYLMRLWYRIVEYGFHLLYNQMAWTYDMVSWTVSMGQWREWQLASLEYVNGREILELAHGPGHMLVHMAVNLRFNVIGCDISPAMGAQAQRRLRKHGIQSPAVVRCDVKALPFCAERFDTVLSQFPTSYISQPETLAAVHRVLKPYGRVVILPEGHLTGRGPIKTIISWLFRITGQTVGDELLIEEVDQAWQPYLQMLRDAGFAPDLYRIRLRGSGMTVIVGEKTADH